MFYHWLYPLSQHYSYFNIFKYITFRSFLAFVISFFVSVIWGKYFIEYMKKKQFGQVIRDDGPKSHLKKSGTPTFGGVFILGSAFLAIVLTGNFASYPVIATTAIGFSYFCLGYLDDYLKIIKKNSKGVPPRGKLLWQLITVLVVFFLLIHFKIINTLLYMPFIKGPVIDLGWFYLPFACFVVVGSSNAVNLTDGLDGLAIGPVITSALSLGVLSYVVGHRDLSAYLLIPYVGSVGELLIIAAAIIGAGMGFLWYNAYPAQIFMGDVGSLSLGGILGAMSVITKNEFLFTIIGGIFVIEALSVIIQVTSYKLRKKRIFKMAPIHHHFELTGWPESKVIVRFWIVSMLLAIMAIATLKIR